PPQRSSVQFFLLFSRPRPPPTSTLFPYTTLFRSGPLRSPGPQGNRGSGAQAGVDYAQRKVAPGVARPIAPFFFEEQDERRGTFPDRKSTRLNSSHVAISYAVFCLKKKKLLSRRPL